MRIVITGACGFLGSLLVKHFSAEGDFDVLAIDKKIVNERVSGVLYKKVALESKSLNSLLLPGDVLINCAGCADIEYCHQNRVAAVTDNILATTRLLDSCINSGCGHFINLSSYYVYGDNGSFYAASKRCAEDFLQNYNHWFGLPYTNIRLGSLYGCEGPRGGFISRLFDLAEKNISSFVKVNPSRRRAYLSLSDFCALASVVVKKPPQNCTVDFIGPAWQFEEEIVEIFNAVVGSNLTPIADMPISTCEQAKSLRYGHHPEKFVKRHLLVDLDLELQSLEAGIGSMHDHLPLGGL